MTRAVATNISLVEVSRGCYGQAGINGRVLSTATQVPRSIRVPIDDQRDVLVHRLAPDSFVLKRVFESDEICVEASTHATIVVRRQL